MAVSIKHKFVTAKPDSGDADEVSANAWNDDHDITGLDKASVGLDQVDNTSDADKPVSTATQSALSAKANSADLATVATTGAYSDLTGTPTLGTAAALDAGTADGNVVQVQTGGKLPALDGSLLTGISGGGDMLAATYDPNSKSADAFDQDNMVDGTTNKNYTGTEKSKLSGIESNADVTDAVNIASSIHGVTGKTTPVDADELGLIDSEASNVLKKLTWANLKSFFLSSTIARREVLTANRTYYVSTSGSDSNDGLSAGSPFATLNKARDVILTLDLNGFTVTIQHAASQTPTSGIRWDAPPVGGNVTLDLGGSFLQTSGGHAVVNNAPFGLTVQNGKLGTTGGFGSCLTTNTLGLISLGTGLEFGSAVDFHINCGGGNIVARVSYTISGGAGRHLSVGGNGIINAGAGTVTLTGTPAFSGAFAWAEIGGAIIGGATYSGSATGKRFLSRYNATITVFGAGANYYPGDVAGEGTNAGTSPYGFYG